MNYEKQFFYLFSSQFYNFISMKFNCDISNYIFSYIKADIYNQILTFICDDMYLFDCKNVYYYLKLIHDYNLVNNTILSIVRGWYLTIELYNYDDNYFDINLSEKNMESFKLIDSSNLIQLKENSLNSIAFQFGIEIVHCAIFNDSCYNGIPDVFYIKKTFD